MTGPYIFYAIGIVMTVGMGTLLFVVKRYEKQQKGRNK